MEKPTKRVRGGVNTEGRKVRRQEARRLRSHPKIGFGVADSWVKFENVELKMDQNYRIISLVETFGIFLNGLVSGTIFWCYWCSQTMLGAGLV